MTTGNATTGNAPGSGSAEDTHDVTAAGGATTAYAAAGVDIEAGDRAVELMKQHVARTARPEVLGGLGGFAGFFDAAPLTRFRHPVLATSTDGVGTKVAIAQALDIHDTIGFDLVGMLVDDLVVVGAEPLFMTDYIACGRVVPERIAAIVEGISAACVQAGCALLGGETAEHPGLMEPDAYDIAGATTGVVEKDAILGPDRVRDGDAVLAMASSGLHSNGYSLVRRVFADAGWAWERQVPELRSTLGEAVLTPTRVYASHVLALVASTEVHALSHITGGGLAANLARVIPAGFTAVLDRSTWVPPRIFTLIQELGSVAQPDIEQTLNMGVGMVAVLPQSGIGAAQRLLADRGIESWQIGTVSAAGAATGARLVGSHPRA